MSEKNSFESAMDFVWTLVAIYAVIWCFMLLAQFLAWFVLEGLPAIFSGVCWTLRVIWYALEYLGRKTLRGLRHVWDNYI